MQASQQRLTQQVADCALVSSSGALLVHKHGRAIDRHRLVIRIGLSPVASFEGHVGSKTDVRFVQLSFFEAWRNMSTAKLRATLVGDRLSTPNASLTFTGTQHEIQKLKLKQRATEFMQHELAGLPYSALMPTPMCNMTGCRVRGRDISKRRYPSSGTLVLQLMFDALTCTSVRLYGFDDPDHGRHPYHYWRDGSVHDGLSSVEFYRRKLARGPGDHAEGGCRGCRV